MKTILFLILIGLGVTACNSSRNIVKLTGVKWVLEKLDGKPLQMKENGNKVYIHFNDTEKRADGMAGCNRFFGYRPQPRPQKEEKNALSHCESAASYVILFSPRTKKGDSYVSEYI